MATTSAARTLADKATRYREERIRYWNGYERRPASRLLVSAPILVRSDLAANFIIRSGKGLYERFLNGYWRFLTNTVLV